MNIAEFFQQSEGKWFSQRTTHDLTTNQSASGKSDLWVEVLTPDDAALASLCQQAGADAATVDVAVRVRWQGEFGNEAKAESGSTLLVAIASPSSNTDGTLLCQDGSPGAPLVKTHYSIGLDEALTLTTQQEGVFAEERIWYASPALRFRTSTIKHTDGFSTASFCSEIRMGGAKPAASQQATAQA